MWYFVSIFLEKEMQETWLLSLLGGRSWREIGRMGGRRERQQGRCRGEERRAVLCLLFLGEGNEGALISSSHISRRCNDDPDLDSDQLYKQMNIDMIIINSLRLLFMTLTSAAQCQYNQTFLGSSWCRQKCHGWTLFVLVCTYPFILQKREPNL